LHYLGSNLRNKIFIQGSKLMKFKQLAIASALMMASSAASALMINMSNITINGVGNTVGGLQWTATPVTPSVDFNLGSTNSLVTFGSLNINLFNLTLSTNPLVESDSMEVAFLLTPPSSNITDNTGTVVALDATLAGGLDRLDVNFGNEWFDMGQYKFRFLDTEIQGNSGSVNLMAEFQIPEPSVLGLFGAGLLGLGAIRRRKIKS
jgi:hypothetical protein